MISVYLTYNNEWKLYQFEDWFQARKEFSNRNIHIAETCILELCYISDNVTIKSDTIIKKHSLIESDVVIGYKCLIREDCHIEHNTQIGNYVILEQGVNIGYNSLIANHIHLNYRCKVSSNTNLTESIYISHHYFDRCISYVGDDKFYKGCFGFHVMNETPQERENNYKELIKKNPKQERNDRVVSITEDIIHNVLIGWLNTK